MADPTQQLTAEQTLALITEAKNTRGDRFIVKVAKRKSASGAFEVVAEFADAIAFHFSSPEPWISQILGGGEYRIKAFHMDANTLQIGSFLTAQIAGQNLNVPNVSVMDRPEWLGPRTATFLGGVPQAQAPQNGPAFFQQPPGFLPAAAPGTPQVVQGYGTVVAQAPQAAPQTFQQQQDNERQRWLEQRERDLQAREAKAQREQAEKDAELKRAEDAQRLRNEIAEQKRDFENKLALAVAQQPKGGSTVETITAVVAAVSPIVTAMMDASAKRAEMMLKMQLDAQERADRRAEEDRKEQRRLAELQLSKPAMTEETRLLISTLQSQGTIAAESMKQYMDATTMVTKNSVAMIETIASLKLGDEPENPLLIAAREAIAALRSMNTGTAQQARRAVAPQQNFQQAALAPVPQIPPPVAQVPVQRFDGLPQPPAPAVVQGGAAGGTPQAQPPSNGGTGAQVPTPPITESQALALIQRHQPPSPTDDPVQILELAIRAHHNPTEVAAYLFASSNHPRMLAALREVGGEIDDLFKVRLGAWANAPEHMPYLMQLGGVIDQIGVELGYFDDDEDGPPEQIPPSQQTVNG